MVTNSNLNNGSLNQSINETLNNGMHKLQDMKTYIVNKRLQTNLNQDIWFNDISVLFDTAYIIDIIPTTGMTLGEKINALTRFSFFLAVLLTIVKSNYVYMYVFIVPVIITYIIYIFSPNTKEFFKNNDMKKEDINVSNNEVDLNKVMEDALTECQEPTKDNPVMNIMLTDNLQKRKPACNINDPTVAENVNNLINDNTCQKLYADTNLLMNTEFGVRDFYTMPNSQVPNDQGAFVKWLYETPVSCALGDTGTLKQVRGCAFNNKSLSEIKEEIPKLFNEPIPAQ